MCYSLRFRGLAWGPGVLRDENLLGHAREVGYHPIVVCFNIRGHLGGQMGETA